MSNRKATLPCIICGKKTEYLWPEHTNLDYAVDVVIQGSYGSGHDTDKFHAYMCDGCVTDLRDGGYLRLEWSAFTPTNEGMAES